MTTQTASAETGSNGATVATGDTGTPAWDAVSIGTGAALTYSNTGGCKRGSLCYSFSSAGTSSTAYGEWNVNAGASAAVQYHRTYIDPADFTSVPVLARGMDSAGSTQRWRLAWTGTAVQLRDSANSTVFTSSTLSSGTRYRVEWRVAGSTTGAVQLIVYVGESATTFYDSGASTGNFGGVIQRIRMGIGAGQTSVAGKCDDFGWSDTAALGPVGTFPPEAAFTIAADAPTAALGSNASQAALTIAADAPVPAFGMAPSQGALTIAADAPATAIGQSAPQAAFNFAADAPVAAAATVPSEGAITFAASAPSPALGPALTAAALTFAAPQPAVSVLNAAGQPFLTALLGPTARIVFEAAFGADLTDIDGSGWIWTDLGTDPRHAPGVPITIGRGDNVSQAGSAAFTATLNNAAGDYTPLSPAAGFDMALNTPFRERMTLDGSTWFIRYQGYLDGANPVTDQSARVKGVFITALGKLAALGGLKKPLKSPLYRAISAAPVAPYAWWPMEDGKDSTAPTSAITGIPVLTVTGTVALGSDAGPGAPASVDFSGGGSLSASLPVQSGTVAWRFAFAMQVNAAAPQSWVPLQLLTTGGTVWELEFDTTSTNVTLYTGTQQPGAVSSSIGLFAGGPWATGSWHSIVLDGVQTGADMGFILTVDGVVHSDHTAWLSQTMGWPTVVTLNPPTPVFSTKTSSAFRAAALAVWASNPTDDLSSPAAGWSGETADARLARLCAEEGIAFDVTGTSDVTMGPQAIDAILPLLREAEAADHGVLYDGLGPGLGYQCRSARYNAASVLTLDMGADPPEVTTFGPVFDKQAVKNLYAVSRKNGGSATVEQVDGPLGTAKIGIADGAATINVDTDDVVPQHAGWLVRLGTIPGFRFPGTGLNMRGVPAKAADVLALTIGARITIQNPASKAVDLPPDDIDQVVEGWTEITTADSWIWAPNCSPWDPWVVGEVDDPDLVVAADDAAFAAVVPAGTTGTYNVAVGTLWSTDSGDYPLDLILGRGEVVTCSGVTGISSPQAFTLSARGVNGVTIAHPIGASVDVATPAYVAL